jgi:D-alanine-D-alanine ligase
MLTLPNPQSFRFSSSHQVAVLYGGRSNERQVSLQTGQAIYEALIKRGYQAHLIDPQIDLYSQLKDLKIDVVYLGLHGTYGEDGCIQGFLEWSQIPYTGSGVQSSSIVMNKELTRRILQAENLPVAQGVTWKSNTPYPQAHELSSPPWVLKPVAEGSSVGVKRCENLEELHYALKESDPSQHWLIEQWITGVELSIMVLDGQAWGGVEIEPRQGWYDFEAKYQRTDTQYHLPPRIPVLDLKQIQKWAEKAYCALECRGVVRVDVIYTPSSLPSSHLQGVILELNTLPGMTATSLVPKMANARGVSFEHLVELILQGAQLDYEN